MLHLRATVHPHARVHQTHIALHLEVIVLLLVVVVVIVEETTAEVVVLHPVVQEVEESSCL
jgi:hypothetical protein